MKGLIASALVLACCAPALADSGTSAWNVDAALQVVDVIQTQTLLHPTPQAGCVIGQTWETDPVARPFVHSAAANIGAAVALNVVGRLLFRHSLGSGIVLGLGESVEIARNAHVLHVEGEPCR